MPVTALDQASPLELRSWRESDLDRFAEMNADPEVMRFMLNRLSRDESAAMITRMQRGIDERGWGVWAVEVDGQLAGFTGLSVPRFKAHFTPCVEIGWRFRPEYWGRGFAYRAARLAEAHAFGPAGLDELVTFTAALNLPSRGLMERLGYKHNPADDFEHPLVSADNPLLGHVLYRKLNRMSGASRAR